MSRSTDDLARRILSLELKVRDRTPQLTSSSIDDGFLLEHDDTGTLTSIIGKQFDGTHVAASVSGPVPAVPSGMVLEAVGGGVNVSWNGSFEDGAVAPMDMHRVDIVVDLDPDFSADTVPPVASIISARGGSQFLALPPAVEVFFALRAVSLSGKTSAASTIQSETALEIEGTPGLDGSPGVGWETGDAPPEVDMPTAPEGTLYFRTSTGDVYKMIAGDWVFQYNLTGAPGVDATVPDPVTPTATPVLEVRGNVRSLIVKTPYQDNPTESVMDIYVGTVADQVSGLLPLTGTFYHGQTQASSYVISTDADDVPLEPGVDYVVVARWRSGSLSGPRSAEYVEGLHLVTNDDISADYAYFGNVDVDQLQGGTMSATVLLAGSFRTADSGPRVEVDGEGIRVFDTDSTPTTVIPSDGSGGTYKGAQGEFENLTVTGPSAFRDTVNEIGPGAAFILRKGTTAPVNAPSAISDHDSITLLGTPNSYGLSFWEGGATDLFYTVRDTVGGPIADSSNSATGTLVASLILGGSTDPRPWGGIVRIGSSLYTLGWTDAAAGSGHRFLWWITKYSVTTGVQEAQVQYTPRDNASTGQGEGMNNSSTGVANVAIGTDGTNVIIVDHDRDLFTYRFQTRSPSTLATSATVTTTDGGLAAPTGVVVGSFDFGASRFIVSARGSTRMQSYNSSGTLQSNENFEQAGSFTDGIAWDGSAFRSYEKASSKVYKHTDMLPGSTYASTWSFKYAWTNGSNETLQSPVGFTFIKKRSRIRVTGAAFPTAGATPPDGIAIYMQPSAGVANWARFTSATQTYIQNTQPTFAITPPTVSTYPDGVAAEVYADEGGFSIDGRSDGDVGSGTFRDSVAAVANEVTGIKRYRSSDTSNVANATPTQTTLNAELFDSDGFSSDGQTYTVPAGKGGLYDIRYNVSWEANNTGRRCAWVNANSTDSAVGIVARSNLPVVNGGEGTNLASNCVILADGDVLRTWVYQTSTIGIAMLTGFGGTSLSVIRMGDTP